MECLVTFLILFVTVVFVTGSMAHAHSRRARRRLMFARLARRYAGSYVPAGLWRRAAARLRYGETQATLQEMPRGWPYSGRCTQITIAWPDAESRCEVVPRKLTDSPSTLYFLREFLTGDVAFDRRFAIRGLDERCAGNLMREGVRWQLERLAQLFASDSVYVVVQNGQITIRKPDTVTKDDELLMFVERSLELYDQMMLTRAHGIEFLDEHEAHALGDVICPVCGETVVRDLVFCRRCKTPHHADCWQFVGACSVYGCGERSSLEPQRAHAALQSHVSADNPQQRPQAPYAADGHTSQT